MNVRRLALAMSPLLLAAPLVAATAQAGAAAPHALVPQPGSRLTAAEQAAVRRAAPKPPRVTNLAPYADAGSVTLGWHDPDPALFARVVVRYRTGASAPASPREGTRVPLGSPRATTATLPGLHAGRRYAAAVWTRDAMGRFSPRTATTFVVPPAAPHRLGTVSGIATDRAGDPLSGVVVQAYDSATFDVVGETVTNATGRYQLRVRAGRTDVEYDGSNAQGGDSDPTGYGGDYRSVTVVPQRRVIIDARLYDAAAITGRVVDSVGNPVAGVVATATPAYNYVPADTGNSVAVFGYGFGGGTATSGADGTFTVKGVYPDSVRACFDPTGGDVYYSSDPVGLVHQCQDTPHQLRAGQVLDLGTTTLRTSPRGNLRGRVTTATGTGVPGVVVHVAPVGRRFSVGTVFTGSDGGYAVHGLKAGTYRVCVQTSHATTSASGLGYVSRCRTRPVTVVAGRTASGERVVVHPGGSFSGVVRAVDGTPVAGASIVVGGPRSGGYVTTTDATGHWIVEGLRSGRYRACVDATGVAVPRHATGVRSGCFQGGSRFVVRRGHVRIGIDFALADGSSIRGTVVSSATHPLPYINVDASTDRYAVGTEAFATTGVHGHFVVTGLNPGSYHLCFDSGLLAAANLSRCAHRSVVTHAGQVTAFGTEDVGPTGSIRASVHDAAGQALNGADVAVLQPCHGPDCDHSTLFPHAFRVAASWTTYGNGSIRLSQLRPRGYAVCVFGYLAAPAHGPTPRAGYADACTSNAFDVRVRASHVTRVTADLAVAGEVTGTVRDADGRPVPGMQVRVSGSAAEDVPKSAAFSFSGNPAADADVTGADGMYAVRSVAPGDQTVCVRPDTGRNPHSYVRQCYGGDPGSATGTPVPVTASLITGGVDLTLHAEGTIAGTVATQSGAALPRRAQIFVFRAGHPRRALIGSPSSDGAYRTPGLASGDYVLCFRAPGYQAQCYDGVAWSGVFGHPLPPDATQVPVTVDAAATAIDATLVPTG